MTEFLRGFTWVFNWGNAGALCAFLVVLFLCSIIVSIVYAIFDLN